MYKEGKFVADCLANEAAMESLEYIGYMNFLLWFVSFWTLMNLWVRFGREEYNMLSLIHI